MKYDRMRDPEKHAHIWLGRYVVRSEAQVFRNWTMLPFETPADAVLRFGADWGFSRDPTVLVRCFIGRWAGEPGSSDVIADAKGTYLFVDQEAYAIGCPIDATPALFAGNDTRRPARWENKFGYRGLNGASSLKITADSARPETIDYMASRGFSIVPAIKGPGSVEEGVNFLKSYDIVVNPRRRHLVDELIHYSWAIDRQTKEILSKLAETHNHVIDALRYALEGARKARGGGFNFASSGRRVMSTAYEHMLGVRSGSNSQIGWGTAPGRFRGILDR